MNDEDEDFDDGTEIIRAKWTMDGATTLAEAAARLRAFADSLDALESDGWHLTAPVDSDYGFIRRET